jgi:hypothetical protein
MAQLNFKFPWNEDRGFQQWIIEDSWEGTIYLEARLLGTWMGICGSNKILEDREGRFYWWVVLVTPESGGTLQKVVTFLDWDSIAAELGITESWGQDYGMEAHSIH